MTQKRLSPLKQIRKHCIGCSGGSPKEVRNCTASDCELWDLRFGKRKREVFRLKAINSKKLDEEELYGEINMPEEDMQAIAYGQKGGKHVQD